MFISVQHVLHSVPVSAAGKVHCIGNMAVFKGSVNTEALSELSAYSFPAQEQRIPATCPFLLDSF